MRISMAIAVALVATSALARADGPVKFEAPQGKWRSSQGAGGVTTFAAAGKRATARIALHPPEPAGEGAAQFARELAQNPPQDLSDRSEVQTFTSPDGRAVVAVDGKDASSHGPARRCWVFDHGQRVLAELVAGDAAEFKRREQAYMTFVASIRIEAGAAPAKVESKGKPSPVDATLTFTAPPGWKRIDVANAVWLAAPADKSGAAYILLTPAERLKGDFQAWYEHKLLPGPGVEILGRGQAQRQQVSTGYEVIRQRLTLQVRGKEYHEQDVLAAHKGGAAMLVALDATSPAELQARQAEFHSFLQGVDIKPELVGELPAPPAAAGRFPQVELPAGWTLSSQAPGWRTYSAPGSSAQGYVVILVAEVTRGGDPYRILQETRRGLGLTVQRPPETVPLADGRKVIRTSDPLAGPVPATQTVVVARQGREVVVILRANRADLLEAQQATFDDLVGALRL